MIGFHLNTAKGFVSVIDYASKLNVKFFQIFLGSPRVFKKKEKTQEELLEFNQKLKENDMKMIVHGNYLLNFCNDEKYDQKINNLIIDLNQSSLIEGCLGVVIHMGSNTQIPKITVDEAIKKYVKTIQHVLSETPENAILVLETGCGEGNEVGTMIPDLGKMFKLFTEKERKRIKFCIDTCHCFAAGYDLSTISGIENFIELVQDHLDWLNVICIHLNNSKNPCGSKKDFHEDLKFGKINVDGLEYFAKFCHKNDINMIMELKCKNATREEQIEMVKEWIKNKD